MIPGTIIRVIGDTSGEVFVVQPLSDMDDPSLEALLTEHDVPLILIRSKRSQREDMLVAASRFVAIPPLEVLALAAE